jgi:uncharacterized protein (TIGR00730 family)
MKVSRVCIFAASSQKIDPVYFNAAAELGSILAKSDIAVNYGGGSIGLMGKLADTMLEQGGKVTGIIPQFMIDVDWGHSNVLDMVVVQTMHERKQRLIEDADAVIALPGGCGTLEELSEVISLKQLGLYKKAIIILNINGFYNPLLQFFDQMIDEHFMHHDNGQIWQTVSEASQVLDSIKSFPNGDRSAINKVML